MAGIVCRARMHPHYLRCSFSVPMPLILTEAILFYKKKLAIVKYFLKQSFKTSFKWALVVKEELLGTLYQQVCSLAELGHQTCLLGNYMYTSYLHQSKFVRGLDQKIFTILIFWKFDVITFKVPLNNHNRGLLEGTSLKVSCSNEGKTNSI